MRKVTLLLKVMAKSMSSCVSRESSSSLYMLSLKLVMEQLQVSQEDCMSRKHVHVSIFPAKHSQMLHFLIIKFGCQHHSAGPGDYNSARRYKVTFPQTAVLDTMDPTPFSLSFPPVHIEIKDDNIIEDEEHFQIRIVETSDSTRVQVGQRKTLNVTILDSEY